MSIDSNYYKHLAQIFGIEVAVNVYTIDANLRLASIVDLDPRKLTNMKMMLKIKNLLIEPYPIGIGYVVFRNTPESIERWEQLQRIAATFPPNAGPLNRGNMNIHVGEMLGYLTPAPLSQLQYIPRWVVTISVKHTDGEFQIAPQILRGIAWTESRIREAMEPLRSAIETGLRTLGFDSKYDAIVTTNIMLETTGGRRRSTQRRRFRGKHKTSSRKHITRGRKMAGGNAWYNDMYTAAVTIQTRAHEMDPSNSPFLIGGSFAIAVFLHELAMADAHHLSAEEHAAINTHFAELAEPADLDFKYKARGYLFTDHIQSAAYTGGMFKGTLNFSIFSNASTNNACPRYIDLDRYRCCHPFDDEQVYSLREGETAPFRTVEFNSPRELKRKRIRQATIQGLRLLGIDDLQMLYDVYPRNKNAHKVSALALIQSVLKAHPEIAEKYRGVA